MVELKTLSANLLALRKKAGKTQQEVAAKVGMTAAALSAYETGKKQPQLDYAVRLARYYGVTLDSLCGIEDANKVEPMTGGEYLYYFTKLCEAKLVPVEISTSYIPWKEYPGLDEEEQRYCEEEEEKTGKCTEYGCVTLKIYYTAAARFSEPYRRYLELYRAGEIDEELFTLWKQKHFERLSEPLAESPFQREE